MDPDQAFGGEQSNKGAPKSLHLFEIPQLLCDNRWVSHKSSYSLKSPFIINSQEV